MEVFQAIEKVGLAAVLVTGILGMCIWLVKYVATTLSAGIHENTNSIVKLEDKIHKASEYQRKEHERQLELLSKLCAHIK